MNKRCHILTSFHSHLYHILLPTFSWQNSSTTYIPLHSSFFLALYRAHYHQVFFFNCHLNKGRQYSGSSICIILNCTQTQTRELKHQRCLRSVPQCILSTSKRSACIRKNCFLALRNICTTENHQILIYPR